MTQKSKSKKKKGISTLILVLIFVAGLCVLLYPTVSNFVNEKNQSTVSSEYDETVELMHQQEIEKEIQRARDYNDKIKKIDMPFAMHDKVDGYNGILNTMNNGIMGYVDIPKIAIRMPIYHGTDDAVMNIAAGHLEGSTLPVGGAGTHCVISSHRGLPSAKLFTNLDKVEIGDIFKIKVLNLEMIYRVVQIDTVLPSETEKLEVVPGKDYFTLMTCTPYGINTHRLLVRGERVVDNPEEEFKKAVDSVPDYPSPLPAILGVCGGLLLLILVIILFVPSKKKKKKKEEPDKQSDGQA